MHPRLYPSGNEGLQSGETASKVQDVTWSTGTEHHKLTVARSCELAITAIEYKYADKSTSERAARGIKSVQGNFVYRVSSIALLQLPRSSSRVLPILPLTAMTKTSYLLSLLLAAPGLCATIPRDVKLQAREAPLRGSEDLLGYSASNTVVHQDTDPTTTELAPGQTEDANLGVYLDFSNVADPQPIRGSKGGTDPGPREFSLIFFIWGEGIPRLLYLKSLSFAC